MEKERVIEIIKQVIHNPQVSTPPISYEITDFGNQKKYSSQYIDIADFKSYLERLEKQLINRIKN